MKKLAFIAAAALSIGIFNTHDAIAKDLSGKLGFGVAQIGVGITPQISVDWQTSTASSVEAHTGIATSKGSNAFEVGARFNRNLFIEDAQHFYLFTGAGLKSAQIDGANASGYVLEAGAGSRFFFAGLPNLGFSFNGGFVLQSAGGMSLGTRVSFGVHYYF